VANINRRAEFLQRPFDDFDGPLHAGAKTAGLRKDDTNHAACLSEVTPYPARPDWTAGICQTSRNAATPRQRTETEHGAALR